MPAAVLTIGTEVTRGELLNTNSAWLSEALCEMGFSVVEHVSVEDDPAQIIGAVRRLASYCDLVVCTGGLGPTSDDLSAQAVAEAAGLILELHQPSLERIDARLKSRGRELLEIQKKQAYLPRGCEVLQNDEGTAPGFCVSLASSKVCCLPGVPREMKAMFDSYLRPGLAELIHSGLYQLRFNTYGRPEAELAMMLQELEQSEKQITFGYRAHIPVVEVKLLAKAQTAAEAKELATVAAEKVKAKLGSLVFSERGESYAAYVGQLLRQEKRRLAVAESCTGGMIASMLTDVAGSSEYFLFGGVTYSNAAKAQVLGVSEDLLSKHGAVSTQVARAMAEGAMRVAGADMAVSTTGIAGPGGGSEEKPVGMVCFGLADRNGTVYSDTKYFSGSRDRIRTLASYYALFMIADRLRSKAAK
ncbi:MAG: competence/damage-inducible protein A [Myxococcales bacterium]|nr:MAG: competence/damage-inducible protein A [Myxococcales bacterium]